MNTSLGGQPLIPQALSSCDTYRLLLSLSHFRICDMSDYHPTIWRTCRVLAHAQRLACLKAVLAHPGLSVGEVAELLHLPFDKASLNLRALQSRGLLQAQRVSRWVRYQPRPDPLVSSSAPLLAALKKTLLKGTIAEKEIIHILTGFTHPRRLIILKHLCENDEVDSAILAAETGISPPALWRHLKNLYARGLAMETESGWKLRSTSSPLAKTLLRILITWP